MIDKKFANGESFYKGDTEDIKYCVDCFKFKKGSKTCSYCSNLIGPSESSLVFDNKSYHSKCFVCGTCMTVITPNVKFYKDNHDSIICSTCSF